MFRIETGGVSSLVFAVCLAWGSTLAAQEPATQPPPATQPGPTSTPEPALEAAGQAQPVPAPPPANFVATPMPAPEPSPHARHRARRSFVPMVVGLGVFVGSYVFSAAVGLELRVRDSNSSEICLNCRYGGRLFVPLVGPWLFYPEANGTAGKVLTALMGSLQGIGLVLSIWGISRFIASGESEERAAQASPLALAFTPLPGGAYGSARLSW